jgi:hypothetical protein
MGCQKTSTIIMYRHVTLLCLLLMVNVCSAAVDTRYFKVAEWPKVHHGDSYILPLTDPADITHAENLITLGPKAVGQTIVLAHIAPSADGINRDVSQPGHPLWSWHVTNFDAFVDFTIEIYDGNPSMVENDMEFWMNNTGGVIGFWDYTVVEDVTALIPEPATLAMLTLGGLVIVRRRYTT